jgi:hypothetical protein
MSPANGTTGLSTVTATTFSWTCTGATSYNLVIDQKASNGGSGKNLVNVMITTNSYSFTLPENTGYYNWYVHGINGGIGPNCPDQGIHTNTALQG